LFPNRKVKIFFTFPPSFFFSCSLTSQRVANIPPFSLLSKSEKEKIFLFSSSSLLYDSSYHLIEAADTITIVTTKPFPQAAANLPSPFCFPKPA
jgi:hypothetical protein